GPILRTRGVRPTHCTNLIYHKYVLPSSLPPYLSLVVPFQTFGLLEILLIRLSHNNRLSL
ncbi:hypothetical protein M1N69_05855, partial [Thermodesulfovibrionales bacterium]|nr:hypothetical protein [Thermodesulfovibrionales bacterium]